MSPLPRQGDAAKQLAHPSLNLDQIPQRVGFRRVDRPRVAHLIEQLRDDIVVALNLVRQQRGAEELLKDVDDAVDEFEDEQGLDLGGRGGQEQQVGVLEAEDERRRVRVGEVDEVRARGRVL